MGTYPVHTAGPERPALAVPPQADAWEDVERDPEHKGRSLAVAAFWIVGLTFAIGIVVAIVVAVVG
jgi:hypothetical protein